MKSEERVKPFQPRQKGRFAWLWLIAASTAWLAPSGRGAASGESEPATLGKQSATRPADKVAAEVRRIVGNLKRTKYSHRTVVDEAAGSYELDCSGLACYVLKRQLPQHYRNITIAKGRARPLAFDFHNHFAKAPAEEKGAGGWRRIARLVDARPGDILAWRSHNPKTGSTGHVVIIDAVPQLHARGQVSVTVVDSSSSGHGEDTRRPGQTGIGRGTMWFNVDAEGHPLGYRWSSPGDSWRARPIAIGRAVEPGR